RDTSVFEEQALFKIVIRGVDEHGIPVRIPVMGVTPSFFRLARIAPLLGRAFVEDDAQAGHEAKAVLSFGLWQSQFGGDAGVVGRDLRIDGSPYTIVGVMPSGFGLVDPDVRAWTPLALTAQQKAVHYNDSWGYIARLEPRATIEQARAQIDAINR